MRKFKYAWGTSSTQTASQKVGTLNTISCLFNYRLCSKPKPPSIPLPWSAWFIMNALKQKTYSSPRWQIACLQVVCERLDFLKLSCDSEPNCGLCWHLETATIQSFASNRLHTYKVKTFKKLFLLPDEYLIRCKPSCQIIILLKSRSVCL